MRRREKRLMLPLGLPRKRRILIGGGSSAKEDIMVCMHVAPDLCVSLQSCFLCSFALRSAFTVWFLVVAEIWLIGFTVKIDHNLILCVLQFSTDNSILFRVS